jgi:transcriptional regulator with XRE-family HTH domain
MDARRLGSLVRAVRIRKGLRQQDVAGSAGVSRATVSRLESGNIGRLSLDTVERIASVVEVRVELLGRWRGGDGDRLLNWRHSLLADSFSAAVRVHDGWLFEPEVPFSIYGERGVIDQMGWHELSSHLLVVELKTEFVDINEMLATLNRKLRLAPKVAAERGWRPKLVSVWLIVSDTRTNRRHAARHSSLLRGRFALDGRSLSPFLANPVAATFGIAFWTNVHPRDVARQSARILTRVRAPKRTARPDSGTRAGRTRAMKPDSTR